MKIAITNPTDGSDACELQMMAESEADSVLLARLDRQYELVGMGRDAESGLVQHARVRLVAKQKERAMKPELIKQLVEAANMVVKQHDYRELGKPHVPDAIAHLRMAVASIEPVLNEQKPQESYAARQAAWVEANGIKVGSRVRVVRVPENHEDGWDNNAFPRMHDLVDKEVCVTQCGQTSAGISVEMPHIDFPAPHIYFPYFVLEPVEPAPQPPLWLREGFERELRNLLNRYGIDAKTNTPDFELAAKVLAFLSGDLIAEVPPPSESPVMETPDKVAVEPTVDPGEDWPFLECGDRIEEGDEVKERDGKWYPCVESVGYELTADLVGRFRRRRITPEPEREATTLLEADSYQSAALDRIDELTRTAANLFADLVLLTAAKNGRKCATVADVDEAWLESKMRTPCGVRESEAK